MSKCHSRISRRADSRLSKLINNFMITFGLFSQDKSLSHGSKEHGPKVVRQAGVKGVCQSLDDVKDQVATSRQVSYTSHHGLKKAPMAY